MKEIIYYTSKNGKCPYLEWYESLDKSVRLIIDRRIERIECGNYGQYRNLII